MPLKNYELIEIKSILDKDCQDTIVYDLQVEDDSSYIANDMVVHNSVCITKNKTGIHRPMMSTCVDCCKKAKVPIIADGGIVEHGDVAKAIACGATMVMAGSLFAGYDQSAGDIIEIEDRMYKEYYGSASQYNKGEYKNVEGKKILIQYKGDISKLLIELKEDLQSSISYVGGNQLKNLTSSEYYEV